MKKSLFFSAVLVVIVSCFAVSSVSAELFSNRTGDIRITKPDGKTITLAKGDEVPEIPSGSVIELLSMGVRIAPEDGFYQIMIGPSVTRIMKDQILELSVDTESLKGSFGAVKGEFDIITKYTTVTLKEGQVCQLGMDSETGMVEVKSIFGTMETLTFCLKGTIPSGGIVKFSVDVATKNVNVSAITGVITIKALEQEGESLGEGDSKDFECPEIGDIPAEDLPLEEPADPERPEASPHRPRDF